jgi:formylglycine-generating enzyme required for sulfatase activity
MAKSHNLGRRRLAALILSVGALLLAIVPMFGRVASVSLPQGKGGEVIAKPTPTPKKTTTKRTTPSRTTNTSKTNQATKSASEAASAAQMIFWNSIKDSQNPEEFRAYLKKYPNGEFADIARSRLTALETAAKEKAAREEEAKREDAKREEAKRKEQAEKKRPGAVVKNSIGMELVYVPPGSFMMGSTTSYPGEKPAHQVTINYSFYMGKFEVTQAQWQAVMENNPSRFKGENLPVEQVSWDDAIAFIARLNARDDGYTYRLPTEAEWEYACRAGTTGDYAGDLDMMAWHANNSGRAPLDSTEIWRTDSANYYKRITANGDQTHSVGGKLANAFGLYDMHGNVWEWCQDWYHEGYDGAPTNGSAWESGGTRDKRVLRGGSWGNTPTNLRSAFRNWSPPDIRYDFGGLRVVAVPRTQ